MWACVCMHDCLCTGPVTISDHNPQWPQGGRTDCTHTDTLTKTRTHMSWLQHGVNTTHVTKQPPWNASFSPAAMHSEQERHRGNWEIENNTKRKPRVEWLTADFRLFTYNIEKTLCWAVFCYGAVLVSKWREIFSLLTHLCPQPCHQKKLADSE